VGFPDLLRLCKNRTLHVHLTKPVYADFYTKFNTIIEKNSKCNLIFDFFDNPFSMDDVLFTPIPIKHGVLDISGFRIGNLAYLTDCSQIPESSYGFLNDLNILIIDGLRVERHPTHFSFKEAVDEIAKIRPKKAFLTHIAHTLSHVDLQKFLDGERAARPELGGSEMEPLVDGMTFTIAIATGDPI
jgi:phosphoribosyl 1,2-cyclic phosphodiesterase